jgi:hypothetical protein
LSNGNIFTYNQTLFNGKYPSFYNSTTSGLLGLNSSVSLAQPLTIFAMAQSETPNNTFAHIADSLNSGSRVVVYFWNSNSSFRTRLFAGGEIEDLSGPTTFVNSYVANTTASQIYINGALRASGDIGSGALSGLVIANRFTTTEQSWRGHLCEVLIYSSVLSSNDRQQVELYLAEKWNLRTSLSTSNAMRLYESLSPVFNPSLIPGCSLWLDALDINALVLSGSSVTQWNDKSGNGRNAVGNIGTGTYSTTGLNSRPTVQITSSGNMISSVPAGTFSNGIAVFVVFQKTGANNTTDTIVARTVTNTPAPLDIYTRSVDAVTRTHRLVGTGSGAWANEEDVTGLARRTSPTIWSVTVYSTSPTTWLEYLNGTPTTYTITGTASYGDTATTFQIGTRADNVTKMNGNISEIIAYNVSSFSTSQQQLVEVGTRRQPPQYAPLQEDPGLENRIGDRQWRPDHRVFRAYKASRERKVYRVQLEPRDR